MYEDLVLRRKDRAITSSMSISRYTRRKHKFIMKKIKRLIRDNPKLKKHFFKSKYINAGNGNYYPMYYMTRHGFNLVYDGYNTELDLTVREAFEKQFDEVEFKIKCLPYDKRLMKPKISIDDISFEDDGYFKGDMMLCGDNETWIPYCSICLEEGEDYE